MILKGVCLLIRNKGKRETMRERQTETETKSREMYGDWMCVWERERESDSGNVLKVCVTNEQKLIDIFFEITDLIIENLKFQKEAMIQLKILPT